MSYQQNVAAAAAALKRGEDANWELARLTYENTKNVTSQRPEPGKVTMEQWCADVREASGRRFGLDVGKDYKRIWRRYGLGGPGSPKPSFTEARDSLRPGVADTAERLDDLHAPSPASPDARRRVARELLADPDVTADPDVQERIVDTAASTPKLTARTIERADERRPAPAKSERDPNALDYIAALGVGSDAVMAMRRLHDRVSGLVAVLRNDAIRLDDNSRSAIREDAQDLRRASDVARMYADELEIALEGGVSDQRLEDLLKGM